MPTAVGRFFEQLRDRNTWPRRSWYPPERYTTINPKSEEWKKEFTDLQSLIKTTLLTTVGFSVFCLFTLAVPDASILDAKSKVEIALLNIDIDYTSFLYVGPMIIIALSLYIHILLKEWFDKLKPQTKDAESLDIYTMSPDIFNIQVHRFSGIIYNFFFYWMPILVLICFALKWIPQPRNPLGMAFSTFLSSIAIPVLIWIKIRRCPDRQRLIKNLFSWVVLGMTPLCLSLLFFVPLAIPPDIGSGMKFLNIGSGMKLYGVDFHRQDLTNIFLPRADFRKANLEETNLQGANLEETNLQGANLQGANLQGANLQGADLQGANLRGTKLCGAYLNKAALSKATLEGADLREADLSEATLEVPNVSEEQLTTAYYVKGKRPDMQPRGVDDDMGTLSRMSRDNRAKRDHQVNKEKICDKPLAALVKSDTAYLDGWVANARGLFVEKPSLAEGMLKVAIEVDPNHFGAVFQLGRLWHIQALKAKTDSQGISQKEQYQQVIGQYQQAMKIAEKSKPDGTRKEQLAQVYYNLGAAYVKKGDYEKKKGDYDHMNDEYNKAIDVLMKWQRLFDISDDKVLTNLGISHLNKVPSETSKARSFLEQAIDMNPNNDVAKNAINGVKTLEMRLGR